MKSVNAYRNLTVCAAKYQGFNRPKTMSDQALKGSETHALNSAENTPENTRPAEDGRNDVVVLPMREGGLPVAPNIKGVRHVRDLARKHTRRAFATLLKLMEHAKDERVRLAATKELLNRGWGMPAMELQIEASVGRGENDTASVRRKQFAALGTDPDYTRKVVAVLQANGLLPTPTLAEDLGLTEHNADIEEAQIITPEPPELPPPAVFSIDTACTCTHLAREHPGGAACIFCQCPLLVLPEARNTDA